MTQPTVAQPPRRVIQRRSENAVSKRVLAGEFTEGDTVLVDYTAAAFISTKSGATAPAA